MSNQVYSLETYDFASSDTLLFDANIWLYIYGPSRTRSAKILKSKYQRQFRRIRGLKVPIFLDVLVLSEFINAYSRQQEKCLICRLGGTQWNPTYALGSVSLHPTYKKMANY